ncbi:MAG: acyltransferase [Colwellia sp.]|nr:acyltransferase [Colwellia sp.]
MDIARGLAALRVFFYHKKQIVEQSPPLLYELAKYGYLGVPMFFVIYGYVIAHSAEASLSNGSDIQEQFNAINPVYWSLAIQFYLLVYLALHCKKYSITILLIVTAASFLNQVLVSELNGGLFIHYWQMFACGLALAYLHKGSIYFQKIITKRTLIMSSFLNIIILISLLTYISFNSIISNFSFAVVFVLMLWVVSPFKEVLMQIKLGGITKYFLEMFIILGTISYLIYLLHAKPYQIPEMFVRQIIEPNNITYGILTIVLTIILCAPFYYFIERKFMSENHSKTHKNLIY